MKDDVRDHIAKNLLYLQKTYADEYGTDEQGLMELVVVKALESGLIRPGFHFDLEGGST